MPRTVEHVIGRRFVPKGALQNQWNLIAGACYRCNSAKANLEDQVSAASLYPWIDKQDERSAIEGQRKSRRSFSRITGKLFKDSEERRSIRFALDQVSLEFGVVAPPQISEDCIEELAHFHVRALFYLVTYSCEAKVGRKWPGVFGLTRFARRSDWGNDYLSAFTSRALCWQMRVCLNGAAGFFRAMIRKHPEYDIWAWALEWNKSFRCVGFVGNEELILAEMEALPELQSVVLARDGERTITIRADVPLGDEDLLFSFAECD